MHSGLIFDVPGDCPAQRGTDVDSIHFGSLVTKTGKTFVFLTFCGLVVKKINSFSFVNTFTYHKNVPNYLHLWTALQIEDT